MPDQFLLVLRVFVYWIGHSASQALDTDSNSVYPTSTTQFRRTTPIQILGVPLSGRATACRADAGEFDPRHTRHGLAVLRVDATLSLWCASKAGSIPV